MGNPAAENPQALLEACQATREILGPGAGHPHGIVCKPNTCKICDTRRAEHIDPYGVVLRIVWRDPTVLNDWHTYADFSDEMTHIVSVGIRTGETPDTIFLTREVCADGELRGTNAIPKPLIVSQERLRADLYAALEQRAEAAGYNFGVEHDALVEAEATIRDLRAAIATVRDRMRFHFDTCTDLGCEICTDFNTLDRALAEGE